MSTQHERDTETDFDYRGARFYDADVARFNSLDPLAIDYPSLSDYVYVAGNPLIFIDPNGTNTIYYDEDGNELFRSEDELDNAVVIVSNDNLYAFSEMILDRYAQTSEGGGDVIQAMYDNSFNGQLRVLGTNYIVDGMIDFLKNTKDFTTTEHEFYKVGQPGQKISLSVEFGSYLYLNDNGAVVIGNESFQSKYVDMTTWGANEEGKNQVGQLHTHPESGTIVEDYRGAKGTFGDTPSGHDESYHSSIDGYRNVVVDNNKLHFYSSNHSATISAPITFFTKFKD